MNHYKVNDYRRTWRTATSVCADLSNICYDNLKVILAWTIQYSTADWTYLRGMVLEAIPTNSRPPHWLSKKSLSWWVLVPLERNFVGPPWTLPVHCICAVLSLHAREPGRNAELRICLASHSAPDHLRYIAVVAEGRRWCHQPLKY
jgi:hypothetical protein